MGKASTYLLPVAPLNRQGVRQVNGQPTAYGSNSKPPSPRPRPPPPDRLHSRQLKIRVLGAFLISSQSGGCFVAFSVPNTMLQRVVTSYLRFLIGAAAAHDNLNQCVHPEVATGTRTEPFLHPPPPRPF